MMSLFVADNGASNRITISDAGTLPEMPQSQTPDIARTPGINSAACGLFFGDTPLKTIPSNPQSATDPDEPIALQGDPASDLRQAIAFDLAGEPARARRLYLWLTATDPNVTTTIDCGNGIILTGTITSLAQKRLKALDAGNPDLARSREIDAVIAAATVAPGPELPNPPTIKRNRDFYNNTIAANVPPEDSITPRTTMKMDVNCITDSADTSTGGGSSDNSTNTVQGRLSRFNYHISPPGHDQGQCDNAKRFEQGASINHAPGRKRHIGTCRRSSGCKPLHD